jgi:kynurenine formamidase
MKIHDLTLDIFTGAPSRPENVKSVIWTHDSHDTTRQEQCGYSWETKGMILSDNGGTHVTAISHMDPDPAALSIDLMDLSDFFGTGVCIDVSSAGEYITAKILDDAEHRLNAAGEAINKNDVLLLYTGHYDRHYGSARYLSEHPGLDVDGTRWIASRHVKSFGIDTPSIDNPKNLEYPAHMVAKQHWLVHMENLIELAALTDRRFLFMGLPLKIVGGNGSPIRAVAVTDD